MGEIKHSNNNFILQDNVRLLYEQSYLYKLNKVLSNIHRSTSIKQLKTFTISEIKLYCNTMKIDYNGRVKSVLNGKIENLKTIIRHNYIENKLFNKRSNIRTMRDTINLDKEILVNGILYYYYRLGEVTLESLLARYNYYELYHMFSSMNNNIYIDSVKVNKIELANIIINYLRQVIKQDSRCILTLNRIVLIHNTNNDDDYNISNDVENTNYNNLLIACFKYGVTTTFNKVNKPIDILKQEYIKEVLSPTFYNKIEDHRDIIEVVSNRFSLNGTNIIKLKEEDYILYGLGDGLSQYSFITYKELYNTWFKYNSFLNPIYLKENVKIRFSLNNIYRLLRIIEDMNSKITDDLKKLILKLITLEYDKNKKSFYSSLVDIKNDKHFNDNMTTLFNISTFISDLDINVNDEVEMRNTIIFKLFKLIREFNKSGNSSLYYVKFYDKSYKIDYNSELDIILQLLSHCVKCVELGLFKSLKMSTNILLSTSMYYINNIKGNYFNMNTLK